MQNTTTQEIIVGLFIVCGIVALFFMATQISSFKFFLNNKTYTVNAKFENIGGIKIKSPVSVAGVRIGKVSAISVRTTSYEAIVEMQIESQYKFPVDTTASIFTSGILGEQYISLEPGGLEEYLTDQDTIDITQSAIVLEQLIFKFLSNNDKNKNNVTF